jgi:hypothetical protein
MASSSKAPVHAPVQTHQQAFAQHLADIDADSEAILAGGYGWNDPNANSKIQARNPGAPCLVGSTIEQCSRGSRHAANAAAGHPSRKQPTSAECSRCGTNCGSACGGGKGKGGDNKEGSGIGKHSAKPSLRWKRKPIIWRFVPTTRPI